MKQHSCFAIWGLAENRSAALLKRENFVMDVMPAFGNTKSFDIPVNAYLHFVFGILWRECYKSDYRPAWCPIAGVDRKLRKQLPIKFH